MICIRCKKDCNYPDRKNRRCPGCGGLFAFEPREGDPINDVAFDKAIEKVSSGMQVRWGVENLYYEVCRRKRGVCPPLAVIMLLFFLAAFSIGFPLFSGKPALWLISIGLTLAGIISLIVRAKSWYVAVDREKFRQLWTTWCGVHGMPARVILRREHTPTPEALEPDLTDYSFDRAVICDRARTVDLLLANNFHFENNCAVLSMDGYPQRPFAAVREMLKRNPRLQVFVLHDCTPDGCRLAQRLAQDRDWFAEGVKITDVGLRPAHAGPFRGMLLAAERKVSPDQNITAEEAMWLSSYVLELAAIRPEQVLKRLFVAINKTPETSDKQEATANQSSDGDWIIIWDRDSFGSDADDADGAFDSFG